MYRYDYSYGTVVEERETAEPVTGWRDGGEPGPPELPHISHGTPSAYRWARCRCPRCREWKSGEARAYRQRLTTRRSLSRTRI